MTAAASIAERLTILEEKVREILSDQPEPYAGLRIQVVGGGCSGFSYRMGFDKAFNDQSDAVFEFEGLKVFIDKASLLYMDGSEVDYVDGLHGRRRPSHFAL